MHRRNGVIGKDLVRRAGYRHAVPATRLELRRVALARRYGMSALRFSGDTILGLAPATYCDTEI